MSRIADAIIDKDKVYAGNSPALNLKYGGMNGFLPRIGFIDADGKVKDEWINNAAYVKRNIIPVVLKYPKFLDYMPDSDKWIQTYKALIELHPLTIEGLTSGLTVETDEHAVGGGGEMQEEITNVTRARSTITFTYKEKAGKAIQKFLDYVIRYGYMDPDTKKPLIADSIPDNELGGIYTPDFYTGTTLFIEPDITNRYVIDAWLSSNMFFKSNGDRTGKRDIHSPNELLDLSIECSSITLNNDPVIRFAQTILSNMTVLSGSPDNAEDYRIPVEEIDPNIDKQEIGFDGLQG